MMEPTVCRQRVGQLIAEQADALAELITFLEREHEQLRASDVTALESAIREHQRSVARVIRTDEARASLCRELGYGADARGFEEVMRWCDPEKILAPQWARCTAIASQCRALNDRNGALVGARLRHVQARLATLIQGRGETVSYGPRGAYAFATSGQVIKVDV
jgi:flagellar biosynthesis protein FlgN